MKKQYLLLTLILLFLSIGAFQPFGCMTTISGTVTDTDSSLVEGAVVTITDDFDVFTSSTTTNSEGVYTFTEVPYNDYTITVNYECRMITKIISTSYFSNGVACSKIEGDAQFSNYSWQQMGGGSAQIGGISMTSESSYNPSISANDSGIVFVAWTDWAFGEGDICVKQFNNDNWEELDGSASAGGVSNNSGWSSSPSIAVNDSGYPVVAWHDDSPDYIAYNIYIKQWNGTSWDVVGSGSASSRGISNTLEQATVPSLKMNSLGDPIVAWRESVSNNDEIYLKQWNGTTWEEIGGSATGGGISNTDSSSHNPSLAINGSGHPVVAWRENTGNYEIYVKQWNGTIWQSLGGSASGGGISDNSGGSTAPSLSINGSGHPVVAWSDDTSGNYEIYLKQWNGTVWEEIGSSATGGGISNNADNSSSPSLAINNYGYYPVVTWHDYTSGNSEIYIKKWNGSSWEELSDSATGGGISNTSGGSLVPSIVITNVTDRLYVAWYDDPGNYEIYVKQYAPDE